ncbi:unnamed protein product [Rhizoctonia solani]|uniref:Protein phosphatase 1 regulatory subunit 7 n=1 Tax=Rhizoctonia solani TaxID=456999 RepID=A0A8H3AKF9_9AGAM|nr:unnamed protein product [Rhizoctonia solani]
MTEQTTAGSKGINDLAGNVTDALASDANLTTQSTEPAITDVTTTQGEAKKARVVVEYIDHPNAEAQESEDEGLGPDAGDPETEDLLAGFPDETDDIDLVHARLHNLDALRLPRFKNHLKRLCLRQNFVTHIGAEDIGSLTELEELDVYDNKLKGVGDALDTLMDLKTLDLSFNLLRSVPHGLERHKSLHTIFFVQNKITKISGVAGLAGSLRSLELGGNRIRVDDRGVGGTCETGRALVGEEQDNKVAGTSIHSLVILPSTDSVQGLETLQALRVLSIQSNRITKLEGLEALTNLEEFYISHNGLSKIEGLEKNGLETLKALRILSIQSNRITKLEGLEELTNLEEFYISHNGLDKIEGLEKNLKLRTFDVSGNTITAVEGLSHLSELEEFWASDNQIATLNDLERELGGIKSFSTIYLERNPCERADQTGYRRKVMLALPQIQQIDATYARRRRRHDRTMNASPRTNKPKRGTDAGATSRGRGAWRGSSFNNPPGRQFGPSTGFPPLQTTHGPGHHFILATLVGSGVVLTTRTNQRWEGTLMAAATEDGTPGAALRNVKDLNNPSQPPQEHVFVPAVQIAGCVPQQAQPTQQPTQPQSFGGHVDDLTFGPGSSASTPWDQFSANEKMFGVVTSFHEETYTTAIDRNAPDFKEKERKAEALAKEIMGASSNNPHIAEERGAVDDSGLNEEDKYSSVIRGQNAYIPPGARRTTTTTPNGASTPVKSPDTKSPPPGTALPAPANANNAGPAPALTTTAAATPPAEAPKPEVPKVAVNGSETPAKVHRPPILTTHVLTYKQPGENNLVGSFREFVTNEKQRLTQKKQAIVKSEKEKRMAELLAFSQNFKLNKPIPKDLVSILTKDSEKAKQIVEKSGLDASSAKARQIGGPQGSAGQLLKKPTVSANPNPASNPSATGTSKVPKMVIQAIPPFNPNKAKGAGALSASGVKKDVKEPLSVKPVPAIKDREPSPTSAAARLNVNAPMFKPGHGSSGSAGGATPSPKPKAPADAPAAPPNPFYGTKVFKKSQMTMLKEEFNPFKFAKVAEASSVVSLWPYTGRKFLMLFPGPTVPPQSSQPPPPQPQQPPAQAPQAPQPQPPHPPPPMQQQPQAPQPQPPHPPPPMQQQPTPPVPGPYEDDHNRSPYMMYPYPYPYPGQPMMQVPPSSGPPGYMQPQYMPPMPYPPHQMAPNQPMYGGPMPGMPHMYMQPGPYPPGAAPRPPPHGYYHQSPQLGHAVPYPMMMQPPPGAPTPHQYDPNGPQNGPPGGPLGVGH